MKLFSLLILGHLVNKYMISADKDLFFVRIWFFIYKVISDSVIFFSVHLTSLFTDVAVAGVRSWITFKNHGALYVGVPCLCVDVMFLFTIFIISFPGKWKSKLWFIPSGILVIHLLNVLRISALSILKIYRPELLQINHKYIFNFIVLTFVFILWWVWIRKYSEFKKVKKTTPSEAKKTNHL